MAYPKIWSRFRGVWLIGEGMDWMIGFIRHLYTPLGTTDNHSAVADLRTLQFTVAQSRRFSVFNSRILEMDFITVCHFKSRMNFCFHRLIFSCYYSATANSEDSIQFNYSAPKLISRQAGISKLDWVLQSESYVTTDGQSASLSWYKAPIRGLRPDFYFRTEYEIRVTIKFLIPWGALSDERTGLSFVCAAGPCQRSLFRS
jgi:hypothetical protein